MIQGLDAAVSGLNTAKIRGDVSANDVANINTPGFEDRSVVQGAKPNLGGSEVIDIRKMPNSSEEYSNVDLATETVEQIRMGYDFKANVKTIQAQDEMIGEILDLKA